MLTLAQQLLDAKSDLPTNLGTAELRQLGADVLRQSLFLARMSNADAVQALRDYINRGIAKYIGPHGELVSADNPADFRLYMKQAGTVLKYDPAHGFPGESALPAEAGSLRDIFSTERLNLVFKMQNMLLEGAAQNIWGNDPEILAQFPAWELVRKFEVEVPRGDKKVKGEVEEGAEPENAWDTESGRWQAALAEADDAEAQKIFDETGRMIARKDSDVWPELSGGAGGYDDNVDNAGAPPYAFNSGMGRSQVNALEYKELGGDPDDVEPQPPAFGSGTVKLSKDRLDADFFAQLAKEFKTGASQFSVKLEVAP